MHKEKFSVFDNVNFMFIYMYEKLYTLDVSELGLSIKNIVDALNNKINFWNIKEATINKNNIILDFYAKVGEEHNIKLINFFRSLGYKSNLSKNKNYIRITCKLNDLNNLAILIKLKNKFTF